MTTDIDKLAREMDQHSRNVLEKAYQFGFQDGGIATRDSIMKAAGVPMVEEASPTPNTSHSKPAKRAPFGLVGKTVAIVLKSHPEGLTVSDLSQKVVNQDKRIAIGSIPNEINRHLGKKYRRESGLIFLISNEADQKETEGTVSNDSPSAPLLDTKGAPYAPSIV